MMEGVVEIEMKLQELLAVVVVEELGQEVSVHRHQAMLVVKLEMQTQVVVVEELVTQQNLLVQVVLV